MPSLTPQTEGSSDCQQIWQYYDVSVAPEGLLYLDTLCAAVHDAILSLEVTVAEAIVVHEDDSIDELLEVVCHHWLRQLLVRCTIEQIQQVRSIHQLPLQTGFILQMCDLG